MEIFWSEIELLISFRIPWSVLQIFTLYDWPYCWFLRFVPCSEFYEQFDPPLLWLPNQYIESSTCMLAVRLCWIFSTVDMVIRFDRRVCLIYNGTTYQHESVYSCIWLSKKIHVPAKYMYIVPTVWEKEYSHWYALTLILFFGWVRDGPF